MIRLLSKTSSGERRCPNATAGDERYACDEKYCFGPRQYPNVTHDAPQPLDDPEDGGVAHCLMDCFNHDLFEARFILGCTQGSYVQRERPTGYTAALQL